MTIPDQEELNALSEAAGNDPDKLARLSTYVSLLAVLDEDIDEGQDPADLHSLRAQVEAARREL